MCFRSGSRGRLTIGTPPALAAAYLIAAVATSSASAHHSPAAFDLGSTVAIEGVITRYVWRNPHVYIYVDGTDELGRSAEWQIEGDPTPLMSRSGWTSSSLAAGDAVAIEMHPDRDPERRHGLLARLTRADGVTLGMRTYRSEREAIATSIAGVWDALPNFPRYPTLQVYDPNRDYTAAGNAARASYSDALYPPAQCVPFATPLLPLLPYLNEIEVLHDRVLMKTEFYSAERVVYTDGRGHPENGPRTNQGHSIGRWDGTTLVVDTRLFADSRLANGPGVPSGSQKHTVERYALGADGTQLEIEITVEDPEYVVDRYTVNTVWNHAPDRVLQPFGCDAANARSFYEH
jgi:hypothetical protein